MGGCHGGIRSPVVTGAPVALTGSGEQNFSEPPQNVRCHMKDGMQIMVDDMIG
jgi:hypothetical protein